MLTKVKRSTFILNKEIKKLLDKSLPSHVIFYVVSKGRRILIQFRKKIRKRAVFLTATILRFIVI